MCPRIFTSSLFELRDVRWKFGGIGGHKGSCLTGSFINFDKSSKFKVARKGSLGLTGVLDVPTWGFEGPAPECPKVKEGFPPDTGCEVGRLL